MTDGSDSTSEDDGVDPFSDLDEQMEQAMSTAPDKDTDESSDVSESSETSQTPQSTESSQSAQEGQSNLNEAEDHPSDPMKAPAFPAGNHLNRSIYVRDQTWDEFEDTIDIDVIPGLKQRGASEITTRELYDAAIWVAINNPDEIIDQLIRTRREEQ